MSTSTSGHAAVSLRHPGRSTLARIGRLAAVAIVFLTAAELRPDITGDAAQSQRRRAIVVSSADVRPVMIAIPGGSFAMGDHHGFVDPSHPSDEIPLHTVQISAFFIGRTDVTVQQYRDFLASALAAGTLRVSSGTVYLASGTDPLFYTRQADQYSRIGWDGTTFTVLDDKGSHPVTSVLWHGAAVYCNWLSAREGKTPSYDTSTWTCDFTRDGYRLPTEAEWEYAARGGATSTYYRYPWGNTPEKARANWPSSGDPYESGSLPWTTPVAFYDGALKNKADFGWPGSAATYQTSSGANGFGLYDMAGNVWQWCNDWYGQSYYASSPSVDPTGPATGTPMPDGKPYRVLRGGNWYNGDKVDGVDDGHSRVSNRDPSYYRGPQDPNHPWYHVGFRPVQRDAAPVVVNTGTVGLFVNDSRAFPGYTLFAPKHNTSTYLIDNEGRVVHKWTGATSEPGQSAVVLENGHLMRATMTKGPLSTGGGEGGRIEEFDWDSNLVWQLDWSTALYMQHHDFRVLPNGNVLMLAVEKKTVEEALAAGFNPSKFQPEITKNGYMLPDYVVEIQPTRPAGGKVVWEWHVWDHLIQDYSPSKANYGDVAAHPERIDAAGDGKQIPAFWNHMNAIYYNAARDEIVLSVRGNSEAWVIDHSTTTAEAASRVGGKRGKGGDLLYRWGNPTTYRLGATKDQMLFQQHDVRWVEEGCPGAGNMTAFNNGLGRNYSTIDEWTPPIGADGGYTRTAGAAFGPSTLTWQYTAAPPASLFAEAISSAQRLPNGNTLICDGTHGTFVEVTSAGAVVWKYVNPVVTAGPLSQGASIPPDAARAGEYMNAVFRVQRYPLTYAGFSGRDLTPIGRVESDPRPVAIFSFGPASPVVGQSVAFTDLSGNTPTAWSWSFGDGGTSTQRNPAHVYPVAGTYTVTLTATNANGKDVTTRAVAVTSASAAATLGVSARLSSNAGTAHAALERATELQFWDPTRANDGYNLWGIGGRTYLLDMEGRVLHTWPIGTNPQLLADGSVLDAANDDPSGFSGFKQVSWDGATVWSYVEKRSTYHPHHDFTRIFNPKLNAYTTLFIANRDFTYDQLIAAGADPSRTPQSGAQMDAIVEVDMNGNVVWEWCFFDHLVQDFSASKPNHVGAGKSISDYPGRLNINLPGHNLKADWLHCNSLDYNRSLDRIVINSVQGEFYVIDHGGTFVAGDPAASVKLAATAAGDFLYRFGDPARYGRGAPPSILEDWTLSTTGHKQLGGSHHVSWIPAGMPGAGHFLIFNNAEYLSEHTPQSYVMEIDPYLDASGNETGGYVNPPDAGYVTVTPPAVTDKTPKLISKQVVWTYASKSNLTLYSQIGCSAQRLANGNTLVTADTQGHILEVTPDGDAVWEYIVPVVKNQTMLVLGDRLPMVNSIFRASRVEKSHPAFAGRALVPGATVAGRTTVENPWSGSSTYAALQRKTETQYWDTANAYNGYTFFASHGTAYLIDMEGHVAHTWPTGSDPRLLDNGNVLDWATNASGSAGLKEVDWNGNTVWEYYESRTGYHPHGDFKRIYDPKAGAFTTLYLANRDLTAAECLAAGCDPADAPYEGAQVDTIVEIDMAGRVIWEWSFWNHAVQTVDATKANYAGAGKRVSDHPGKIDLNLPGRPLRANWLDCNSIDYDQSLDQIVVNSRQGELYVVDHGKTFVAGDPAASIALAATTAGDLLYRFGDPARYGQGSAPSVGANWETATAGHKQMGASSNVQWIAAGLPGAGHLLVFDNNQYLYQRTPQSYVLEISPYLGAAGTDTGTYVNPPAAGYVTWTFEKDTMKANRNLSKQVVWKYGSVSNLTLFSHFGSSAQRLPNGNTLICATTEGYLLEVSAAGDVVWEYINPVTASGAKAVLGDRLPMTNAVPRAVRYPATFAGFTGRDLTASTTITGRVMPRRRSVVTR